jgi:hypothetical protein
MEEAGCLHQEIHYFLTTDDAHQSSPILRVPSTLGEINRLICGVNELGSSGETNKRHKVM